MNLLKRMQGKTSSRLRATALVLGLGLGAGVAQADVGGLPLHGFADAYYGSTGETNDPRGGSGFRLGTLDLYLNPSITDHVRSLAELVVEFDDWYGNGQSAVDVERLQVGYAFNDDLTVWFGRVHTPFGWWNTAYHHGAQLQPTVLRPQFLAFEDHGGIMPSHLNGIWATGHHKVGDLGRVTFDVFMGNSSRNLADPAAGEGPTYGGLLDMNNGGADNSHNAYGGRFGYEFRGGALDTLWVGVHGLKETIDAYDASNTRFAGSQMQFLGGFFHWTPGNWEAMAEYYAFSNTPLNAQNIPVGSSHSSSAWYAEAGYTISDQFTPYARYEKTSFDQTDGYFEYLEGGQSYTRSLVGIRYDINPQTAVKLDGGHTNATTNGGQSYSEAHFQLAVRF